MKNIIFYWMIIGFLLTNNLNAKELSIKNILKKLETYTLTDYDVKKKGSCRYWYEFSRHAYTELFQDNIQKEEKIFYKLKNATLKIHTKALTICKKENEHLYDYLNDSGSMICGNCLYRRQIENVSLILAENKKIEKERIKKEKKLKDDADNFINSLSENTSISKKIKEIESETLEHPDVHQKGICTYWYRFVRNSYDELLKQNIHEDNSIFFKLKDVTLKLHDKASETCKSEESNYFNYLDGSSSCGNCLSKSDISNSYSLIQGIEKQAKINEEENKRLKEQEKKRKIDTDIFLKSLN